MGQWSVSEADSPALSIGQPHVTGLSRNSGDLRGAMCVRASFPDPLMHEVSSKQ